MATPFSHRVAQPSWFDSAVDWIGEQVEQDGLRVTGAVEQQRIRPWSTQLTVPTDDGRLWFKANCRSLSFEPALHDVFADLAPEVVDRPVGVDPARGWLLTRDHGPTLSDVRDPSEQDWHDMVRESALLQDALVAHRDRLLATGLPNCAPATTLDRFDRLLAIYVGLPEHHPAHVPPELEIQLRGARPRLVDAVQCLEASPLPVTWQHGDLHPGNAFVGHGGDGADRLRIFDFGDSQWAHALEALVVPYGWITSLSQVRWPPVLRAYAETWGLEADALDEPWRACGLTHAVNRSMTWWGCLEEATAAEWGQWGEGPLSHLTRVLDT